MFQVLDSIVFPAAKRVIFIKGKKMFLNLPPILFEQKANDRHYAWIYINDQKYHLPFPNVFTNGNICLGDLAKNDFQHCVESFFFNEFTEWNMYRLNATVLYFKKYNYIAYLICRFIGRIKHFKESDRWYNWFMTKEKLQYHLDHPIKFEEE